MNSLGSTVARYAELMARSEKTLSEFTALGLCQQPPQDRHKERQMSAPRPCPPAANEPIVLSSDSEDSVLCSDSEDNALSSDSEDDVPLSHRLQKAQSQPPLGHGLSGANQAAAGKPDLEPEPQPPKAAAAPCETKKPTVAAPFGLSRVPRQKERPPKPPRKASVPRTTTLEGLQKVDPALASAIERKQAQERRSLSGQAASTSAAGTAASQDKYASTNEAETRTWVGKGAAGPIRGMRLPASPKVQARRPYNQPTSKPAPAGTAKPNWQAAQALFWSVQGNLATESPKAAVESKETASLNIASSPRRKAPTESPLPKHSASEGRKNQSKETSTAQRRPVKRPQQPVASERPQQAYVLERPQPAASGRQPQPDAAERPPKSSAPEELPQPAASERPQQASVPERPQPVISERQPQPDAAERPPQSNVPDALPQPAASERPPPPSVFERPPEPVVFEGPLQQEGVQMPPIGFPAASNSVSPAQHLAAAGPPEMETGRDADQASTGVGVREERQAPELGGVLSDSLSPVAEALPASHAAQEEDLAQPTVDVDWKLAEEREWEARRLEIERQAEEARRLKKRKRAEAEILNRVQARLDDHRTAQAARETDHSKKEIVRSEVRENLAVRIAGQHSLPQILLALGAQLNAGNPADVTRAYKKALQQYHPDRHVSAPLKEQIFAEEAFKAISQAAHRQRL